MFRSRLVEKVGILLFTSKRGCPCCTQTKQLLGEIASLTDKIRLEVLDETRRARRAHELEVDRAPTTVLVAANGARLYYVGMPAGRQLGSLIEDVVDAPAVGARWMRDQGRSSTRGSETVIKVFVTTFCPYSPLVVRSAAPIRSGEPRIRAS